MVCFVGDYGAASGLGVSDSEPNLALREVGQFCEQVGVKVLIFGGRPTGPLSSVTELIFQDFSGIVLLATAAGDSSRGFLKEMLSESACRLTDGAVVASVGYAQRAMGGRGQGAPYRLFLSG